MKAYIYGRTPEKELDLTFRATLTEWVDFASGMSKVEGGKFTKLLWSAIEKWRKDERLEVK